MSWWGGGRPRKNNHRRASSLPQFMILGFMNWPTELTRGSTRGHPKKDTVEATHDAVLEGIVLYMGTVGAKAQKGGCVGGGWPQKGVVNACLGKEQWAKPLSPESTPHPHPDKQPQCAPGNENGRQACPKGCFGAPWLPKKGEKLPLKRKCCAARGWPWDTSVPAPFPCPAGAWWPTMDTKACCTSRVLPHVPGEGWPATRRKGMQRRKGWPQRKKVATRCIVSLLFGCFFLSFFFFFYTHAWTWYAHTLSGGY